VLNVQRPGYGGNPIPTVASPIGSSVALITDLIARVYHTQTDEQGVILVGHSIGAAIALAIAAQSDRQSFPVLAVSALGVIPTLQRDILLPDPDLESDDPRFVVKDVPTLVSRFFGPFECLDERLFTADTLKASFEPSKSRDVI
jgi:pimeloyl-ACP methyl ester carboxylesterase